MLARELIELLLERAERTGLTLSRTDAKCILQHQQLRHYQDGDVFCLFPGVDRGELHLILMGEAHVASSARDLMPQSSPTYSAFQRGALMGVVETFSPRPEPSYVQANDYLVVAVMSAKGMMEMQERHPGVALVWQRMLISELALINAEQRRRAGAMSQVARSMIQHIDDGTAPTQLDEL